MSSLVLDRPTETPSKQKRQRADSKPSPAKRPPKDKRDKAKRNPRKSYEGRIYLGRDPDTGKQLFEFVGHFKKKKERDQAVAEAKAKRSLEVVGELPTCAEYVKSYLRDYKARNKFSSWDSTRERLKPFVKEFGSRRMDEPARREAKDWIAGAGVWEDQAPQRSGTAQACVTLYNYAADEDDLELPRNPFRGLGRRTRGRADEPPPTPAEFEQLLDACSGLGEYGPMFRALMLFAAVTLMRPSELYVLKWTDIDFAAERIRKQFRLYRGDVDEPKYGKATVYLAPPALEAVASLDRDGEYVFTSKTGKRLSQSVLSGYWSIVKAVARLDFDFYHATKHYGVHFLWTKLHTSRRGIAAQAGWSVRTVDKMLEIYGHGEVGALEEVEAAWASAERGTVPPAVISSAAADPATVQESVMCA